MHQHSHICHLLRVLRLAQVRGDLVAQRVVTGRLRVALRAAQEK